MNYAYEAYLDRWGCSNKITSNAYRNVLDLLCHSNFNTEKAYIPAIKKVIFNNPATIVIWNDGTKTTVKCSERDEYSEEVGLAMCISKKALGNKGNFNEVFKKHIPGYIKKD